MPFIAVPDVFMCELRMELASQQLENTLYFRHTVPPTEGIIADLFSGLETWWDTTISLHLSENIALREIYLTDLSSATAPAYTQAVSPVLTGKIVGQALPNNVSMCVSFRSAGRGRSSRGRNYVAGLAEEGVNGNTITETRRAGIVAAYNGLFLVEEISSAWDWVIVSRYTGGDPRPSGVSVPVTAAISVDAVVDSQRRRLPGRGT